MTTTLVAAPKMGQLWEQIVSVPLQTDACEDFVLFASANNGLDPEAAQRAVKNGLLPYLYLLRAGEEELVAAPSVAALLDLAAEHGCDSLKSLVGSVSEAPMPDKPAEVKARYERTREKLVEHFGEFDASVWPAVDDSGTYSMCKYGSAGCCNT